MSRFGESYRAHGISSGGGFENLEISCPRVSIMEQTLPPRNCRCKQRFSSWLYTELKALLRTRSNERGGCLACHFRNANICALIVSFEYPFFPPSSLSLFPSVSLFRSTAEGEEEEEEEEELSVIRIGETRLTGNVFI